MSDEIKHITDALLERENEVYPGLVMAIEFQLPCGHYIQQALRNEEIIPRYQVNDAIAAAADKMAFWVTRQGFPHHDCNLVTEANPNGFPIVH